MIDKNLIISGQYSRFAEKIFGTKKISGKKLTELLTGKVDQEIVGTLSRYLLILLNDRVKQDLAVDLNPLSRVKLMVPLSDGRTEEKVVSFNFLRTLNKQGVVSHILVTIQDITALSEAEAKVQQLSQGVSGQLEIVAKIMDVTPEKFCHFCDRILVRLLDINKILKLPSRKRQQFRSQVDMIAIELHRMKGESALLGFASLATSIHQLESVLDKLQKQPMLVGESFVPFTVGLKQLIGEVEKFLLVANALANGREKPPLAESMEERTLIEPKMIENLVQNIANKNRKTVRVLLQQKGVVHIPQHLHQPLRDITVQLVRNAVVHGLEDCQGRANKPKAGRLQIEILAHSGEVTIVVADDGRGIALDKLRQRAITLGIGEPHELNNLSSDRLLNLIFESGLSTRLQVDEDAGRGVGMSVVKTMVQRLAGKIAVRNQEGKGTRFIILIPLAGLSYENLSLAAS